MPCKILYLTLVSVRLLMEQAEQKHNQCCNCEGDCLSTSCPCFLHSRHCNSNCKCHNCKNKPENETERAAAFESYLLDNPLAFTSDDSINQDEYTAISNFAMLTNSVDTEQFALEKEEKPLSKVLSPQVLELSIKTILSAANEYIENAEESSTFEEGVENSVASEFLNILRQVQNRLEK